MRVIEGDPSGRRLRLRHRFWRWSGRGADRVTVPSRPGNAGGGKDPDFGCAFDACDVRVIGGPARRSRLEEVPARSGAAGDGPEAEGGERPLRIPTIRDRVVQTAAKIVWEPIFEEDYED